jgi:hypothetical protein
LDANLDSIKAPEIRGLSFCPTENLMSVNMCTKDGSSGLSMYSCNSSCGILSMMLQIAPDAGCQVYREIGNWENPAARAGE